MAKQTEARPDRRGMPNAASILPEAGHENEDMALWVLELRRRMGLSRDRFGIVMQTVPSIIRNWETGAARPIDTPTRTRLTYHGKKAGMPKLPPAEGVAKTGMGPSFDPEIAARFSEFYGQEVANA